MVHMEPQPPEVLEEVKVEEARSRKNARKQSAMRRGAWLPAFRVPGPSNTPQRSFLRYSDAWDVIRAAEYQFEDFHGDREREE